MKGKFTVWGCKAGFVRELTDEENQLLAEGVFEVIGNVLKELPDFVFSGQDVKLHEDEVESLLEDGDEYVQELMQKYKERVELENSSDEEELKERLLAREKR